VFQGSVQGRGSSADDLLTDTIGIGVAAAMMLSGTVRNRLGLFTYVQWNVKHQA
jgi:hypothetical protein